MATRFKFLGLENEAHNEKEEGKCPCGIFRSSCDEQFSNRIKNKIQTPLAAQVHFIICTSLTIAQE
jgi:hypothetical protein